MRILHIADLHLGKTIYGVSLLDSGDQPAWAERFLQKAEEWKPDAVVIAGDLYDRSSPSGDAVMLLDRLLVGLAKMQIPVLMVAGNHDSGKRLSFGEKIMAYQQIHIAGMLEKEMKHVTIKEKDGRGEVTFWLMPYVFPALVAQIFEDDSVTDYNSAVRKVLEEQPVDFTKRNVLVAHQNVTAFGKEAERGGSESMVGGVGQIDYQVFDGFEYVALGHIHSSYPVGRKEVRYAGSPLCYHFDETKQGKKGVVLVDIPEKGEKVQIETHTIEPLHPMREIRGEYENIKGVEEAGSQRGEYVRVVLTDRKVTPEISEFFHEWYKKKDSILMELVSAVSGYETTGERENREKAEKKKVEEYFLEWYQERMGNELQNKDVDLFGYIGEQVRKHRMEGKEEMEEEKEAEKLLEYILKQEKMDREG